VFTYKFFVFGQGGGFGYWVLVKGKKHLFMVMFLLTIRALDQNQPTVNQTRSHDLNP
jgi:hypothetical protein